MYKYIFLLYLIFTPGCMFIPIVGSSMFPSLQNKDIIVGITSQNFSRGDIVFLEKEKKGYIKRIIGLPGEKLSFQDRQIYINDKPLYEPHIAIRSFMYMDDVILKKDEFYVMGDNRQDSMDSRIFGIVKRKEIHGKMIFRIWRY